MAKKPNSANPNPENRERVGYGNPPKHTQWKKGQSGNPGGVSSERHRLMRENADRAARIVHRQLEALEGLFLENPEKERIVESINADINRLIKDALDREMGTARQSVDISSPDGSMSPKPGVDLSKLSSEALAELVAARDNAPDK